jgi:hypothetical protein
MEASDGSELFSSRNQGDNEKVVPELGVGKIDVKDAVEGLSQMRPRPESYQ